PTPPSPVHLFPPSDASQRRFATAAVAGREKALQKPCCPFRPAR
uniref:Uncharacterized protein n=1 Tax=Cucumis melo TaxID=3656 RepID=A0A9I9E3I8_CUCME